MGMTPDDAQRFVRALLAQPPIVEVLATIAGLGPGFWLCAGAIRDRVWDHVAGLPFAFRADVDVIYYDDIATGRGVEHAAEAWLRQQTPAIAWSVKNQARMARKYGTDADSVERAVALFPETATSVAARLDGARVRLIAPHGVSDLLGVVVRPTPAFAARPEVVRARAETKRWQARWPQLQWALD